MGIIRGGVIKDRIIYPSVNSYVDPKKLNLVRLNSGNYPATESFACGGMINTDGYLRFQEGFIQSFNFCVSARTATNELFFELKLVDPINGTMFEYERYIIYDGEAFQENLSFNEKQFPINANSYIYFKFQRVGAAGTCTGSYSINVLQSVVSTKT